MPAQIAEKATRESETTYVHEIAVLHEIAATPYFWHRKKFHFTRDMVNKTKYIQLWLNMNTNANIEKQ
jgi:hypothetical protein